MGILPLLKKKVKIIGFFLGYINYFSYISTVIVIEMLL